MNVCEKVSKGACDGTYIDKHTHTHTLPKCFAAKFMEMENWSGRSSGLSTTWFPWALYEMGPFAGLAALFDSDLAGAATIDDNWMSVSWLAFALRIVFSSSSWFMRSISSAIFSLSTSTSSRTANMR